MIPEQYDLVIAEIERRWRERTPAKDINDLMAGFRVRNSEMRAFAERNGFTLDTITDPEYQRRLSELMGRLKKEFPNENWS